MLGHIVSGKGLKVDNAKIEVIQNLPLPSTIRDLRSFLRHVGFIEDSLKTLPKSPSHSLPFFARTKISSSTKKGSAHSRC